MKLSVKGNQSESLHVKNIKYNIRFGIHLVFHYRYY